MDQPVAGCSERAMEHKDLETAVVGTSCPVEGVDQSLEVVAAGRAFLAIETMTAAP